MLTKLTYLITVIAVYLATLSFMFIYASRIERAANNYAECIVEQNEGR